MKLDNIVIDSLEYKNSLLYIFYKNYYEMVCIVKKKEYNSSKISSWGG